MSLNWSIEDVQDWEVLQSDDTEAAITECLVWATMSVGIGEITDKNVNEFFARVTLIQRTYGPYLRNGDGSPREITFGDIKRRVGLSTNVFPKESWTKFLRKIRDWSEREARKAHAAHNDEVAA